MAAPKYVSVLSLFQKDPPAPGPLRIEPEPPRKGSAEWLPLYDLQAVAAEFGPSVAADCLGWVRVPEDGRGDAACFVSQVWGRAMEPLIPDGAYCLFRPTAGSPAGRVLLVQHHAIHDPKTGGTYTVARYRVVSEVDPGSGDEPSWRAVAIELVPCNPACPTISITREQADDLRIIAEFNRVIG